MIAFAEWLALPRGPFAMIALLLVGAMIGIRLARLARIPRVVGCLLLGLVLRAAFRLIGGESAFSPPVSVTITLVDGIKNLGLCLILFVIGASFDASHLKAIRSHVWKLSLAEIALVMSLVFLGTWFAGGLGSPIQAVFLAIVAVETAPAATMLVLREYGAKGPTSDHILTMIGLNNITAICLFYVAFQVFAGLGPGAGGIHAERLDFGLITGILLATAGSAAIGCVLGLLLSAAHISLTRFESLLLFFALMLAVTVGAKEIGLNQLIICMFMGLVFTNFSIQPHRLLSDVEPISGPIFAVFFVLAGFKLEIGRLWEVGLVGVVYLAARTAGKVLGARWGVRWAGPRHLVPETIGTTMLCHAGVAIGLGQYLVEHWGHEAGGVFEPHPGALAVNTVILASVAVFELTGPLATRRAVVLAGEVKAVVLMARPGASVREMWTILRRLRRAASATVGGAPEARAQVLTARHAMRTNIESLRDTAKMSTVLHFVEHSRFNHFFVVDEDGHFVGTIDFRDLRNVVFNPVLAQMLTAYDMANTAPPVVLADQPLQEVMEVFHKHDVGSMPVIENHESRRLLGVIEQRDVLRALHVGDTDDEGGGGH